MLIAILDTETSNESTPEGKLLPHNAELVEVGVLCYDTETGLVVSRHAELFLPEKWAESSEKIHNIPQNLCKKYGTSIKAPVDKKTEKKILEKLGLCNVDAICAYNAAYDKNVMVKYFPSIAETPWFCAMVDPDHSTQIARRVTSRKLNHLASDYGISIIAGSLHRALADCELTLQILLKHDVDKIVNDRKSGKNLKYTIIAGGEYNKELNMLVKEWGFRWQGEEKVWKKDGATREEALKYEREILKRADQWRIQVIRDDQYNY